MFLVSLSLALAAEIQPGAHMPGAARMEAGDGYVGAGFLVDGTDTDTNAWFSARGGFAPTDRMAATMGVTTSEVGTFGELGVRFNVIQRKWLRAAPVLFAGSWVEGDAVSTGGGLGLGVEAGARRVRFDLGVPLLVYLHEEDGVTPSRHLPGLSAFEAGLTVRMGSSHANRLRLSVTPEHVGFGYRFVGEHWWMDTQAYGGQHSGMLATGGLMF